MVFNRLNATWVSSNNERSSELLFEQTTEDSTQTEYPPEGVRQNRRPRETLITIQSQNYSARTQRSPEDFQQQKGIHADRQKELK